MSYGHWLIMFILVKCEHKISLTIGVFFIFILNILYKVLGWSKTEGFINHMWVHNDWNGFKVDLFLFIDVHHWDSSPE